MRKLFCQVVIMVVCCVFLLSTQIVIAGPSGGVIKAPQVKVAIKVDGKLDEWNLGLFKSDQKIVLTKKNGFINTGTIDDDNDFSVVVYALYDDKNLYIAADVTDDAIEKGFADGNNWQNDCIEIWIDGAGDKGTMTDRGGNDPDNYQLNVDVNGLPYVYRNDDAAKILKDITSGAEVKGTDYTLEVQIPFSAIPEFNINSSRVIGFSVSFVDSDKGVWNHILWQGEVEHEPTTWGKLEFAQEKLSVDHTMKLSTAWGKIKNN